MHDAGRRTGPGVRGEWNRSAEDRIILRHVGDRATIVFPLPDKTEEVDSYDPTHVIKVNVRIYGMYPIDDEEMDGDMSGMPDAGMSMLDDAGLDAGSLDGDAQRPVYHQRASAMRLSSARPSTRASLLRTLASTRWPMFTWPAMGRSTSTSPPSSLSPSSR
jgi:hypothetical protein